MLIMLNRYTQQNSDSKHLKGKIFFHEYFNNFFRLP